MAGQCRAKLKSTAHKKSSVILPTVNRYTHTHLLTIDPTNHNCFNYTYEYNWCGCCIPVEKL